MSIKKQENNMGKWLSRVIEKSKPKLENYQNVVRINTDNVDSVMTLDIFAPDIKQNPRLDLLTEIELEAFNGWYATCRKPKFNLSHKEATHKAWQLLIESLEVMRIKKRGRYSPEN
jgi:hypothetical protein